MGKSPKYDAISQDFGHKKFVSWHGGAGSDGPARRRKLTPSVSRTVGSAKRRPKKYVQAF